MTTIADITELNATIVSGRVLIRRAAWPVLAVLVWTATRSLAMALGLLLADTAAHADCTPASTNNVTATCTGITTNQGGGAPGSSASVIGYGTGVETGVTVNVDINASVR